jgi:hypothetical protein
MPTKKKLEKSPKPELQSEVEEYEELFGPQEGKFIELVRLEPQTDKRGNTISGFLDNFHSPQAPTLEVIKKRYGPGTYRLNLKNEGNKRLVRTRTLNIAPDKPLNFELDDEFEEIEDDDGDRIKKLELTIEDLKKQILQSKGDLDLDQLMKKFMVYRMMAKVFDNSNDTIQLLGKAYSGNLEALIQGMELGGLRTDGNEGGIWEKIASGILAVLSQGGLSGKLGEKAQEMLRISQPPKQLPGEITMETNLDDLGSMKKVLDMVLAQIDEGTKTATQIADSVMIVSPSVCERLKQTDEETLLNILPSLFPEDKELLADPKTKDILHQVITILKAKG